jgi:hypothetical protein
MTQPRAAAPDAQASQTGLPHKPGDFVRRALLFWPRLDRGRLRRIREEPMKIARLVAPRTNLSLETIHSMIVGRTGAAGQRLPAVTSLTSKVAWPRDAP